MLTIQPDTFLDAIRKNDNQTILELLKAQPSLAASRDKNGASAIFLALYRGNKEAAREIAQRKRVLDAFEAAAIGDLNQLRTIVRQRQLQCFVIFTRWLHGFGPCIISGPVGIGGISHRKSADPNAVARNETGFTPLKGALLL